MPKPYPTSEERINSQETIEELRDINARLRAALLEHCGELVCQGGETWFRCHYCHQRGGVTDLTMAGEIHHPTCPVRAGEPGGDA